MPKPIGQILVDHGVLTESQCRQILDAQRATSRPFGVLAEEMFGVPEREIEEAWADQYAQTTRWVDPMVEEIDSRAAAMISRRQAWQFGLVPMRFDGREVMVCTTKQGLARALRFAVRHFPVPCFMVLAEPERVGSALEAHYPMAGMTAQMAGRAGIDGLGIAG